MKKILRDYTVVFFALTIILLLVIRFPTGVMGVAIIINMSLSTTILVTTVMIREPLEFSIFSSLLLITTLFRLGTNVSTIRNILTGGGASGLIIKAFGDFVLRGNAVVGLIIFPTIVLMRSIVITKGVECVTEVVAQFNLDAIPDKQVATDADLSSSLIDEQQAKKHREEIQREADFCGAIDGATKIAEDDAVMSFVTAAISLIGDGIIGYIQSGDSIDNALSTYPIATVGGGLVGQIPIFLVSTVTGMIVTGTISEGSLDEDVSKQFLAQPQVITIDGVAVAALATTSGMSVIQLALISAGLLSKGYYLTEQIKEEPSLTTKSAYQDAEVVIPGETVHQEVAVSGDAAEEYYKDVNSVYTLLMIELMEMEFGYSLTPLADELVGGRPINRIVIFRKQYAQNMGFVIPSTRLRDSSEPSTDQYCIKAKGEEVARGEILVGYYLAPESDRLGREVDGIETMESTRRIPSRWIRPEDRERAELYGYTATDPLSVVVTHLSEVIKQHAHELMTRQEVVHLVEDTKETAPGLMEEVFPSLAPYSLFQRIPMSFLREGVPIRGLETIIGTTIEVMSETGLPVEDTGNIVERIRVVLKRTITRMHCEDGIMRVATLGLELEYTMVDPLLKGEGGYYLALNPDILQSIIGQMTEQLRRFNGLAQSPVVLTSQIMWVHSYRLVRQFYPNVWVLSLNEIANNIWIQSVDGLCLETPVGRKA